MVNYRGLKIKICLQLLDHSNIGRVVDMVNMGFERIFFNHYTIYIFIFPKASAHVHEYIVVWHPL